MQRYTYLDANATTPMPPPVLTAVAEWCNSGNASCTHPLAKLCVRNVIEPTLATVLATAGCAGRSPATSSHVCVLTSGGSEANSAVILGRVLEASEGPLRVVASRAEHSSVIDLLEALEARGRVVLAWLPVLPSGSVDRTMLTAACRGGVDLLIVQHANSELGSVNDIAAIAEWLEYAHPAAYLHSDCVQTFCKLPLTLPRNTSIAASAHKFHGPKGIGFYVKPRAMGLFPIVAGKQNDGLRGGTINSPACAGMLAAIALCRAQPALADPVAYVCAFFGTTAYHVYHPGKTDRARDIRGVAYVSPGIAILSPASARLPNTLALAVIRVADGFVCGTTLKTRLEANGLIVANGSACQAGKPSPLMTALPIPDSFKKGMIRVSTSRLTTEAHLRLLCTLLAQFLDIA